MNSKITYIIAGIVLVGVIVWGTWMKPWSTPEMPLDGGSEGAVMHQIDPPELILQAGSAPLGQNESKTGFANEDGVKMYNGKPVQQDGEIIQFDMGDDSEDDIRIVDPKIELVDENGNPVSKEEADKLLEDIYGE